MSHRNVPLKLVPAGLVLDRHEIGVAGITVHAHSASPTSHCPACGLASSSVHSRYDRALGDLPAHGRRLGIRLSARRFRCRNTACERRVFTERFAPNLIQAHARRTSRLDVLTHAIALALGGRPGERLAERLSMPVSVDTLLRLLRRRATPTPSDVRVVGINDFAWLKGQRYGTIICDLERRCTIDLLPDREGGTVAAWLAAHPGVEIVCRDRGGGFREAAAKGAPQALQICDRWHLLENATAAFVEAVKRHMGDLRRAITGGDIDPEVLSSAEKVQWAGWKRRDEVNGTVRSLKSQGHSITLGHLPREHAPLHVQPVAVGLEKFGCGEHSRRRRLADEGHGAAYERQGGETAEEPTAGEGAAHNLPPTFRGRGPVLGGA